MTLCCFIHQTFYQHYTTYNTKTAYFTYLHTNELWNGTSYTFFFTSTSVKYNLNLHWTADIGALPHSVKAKWCRKLFACDSEHPNSSWMQHHYHKCKSQVFDHLSHVMQVPTTTEGGPSGWDRVHSSPFDETLCHQNDYLKVKKLHNVALT